MGWKPKCQMSSWVEAVKSHVYSHFFLLQWIQWILAWKVVEPQHRRSLGPEWLPAWVLPLVLSATRRRGRPSLCWAPGVLVVFVRAVSTLPNLSEPISLSVRGGVSCSFFGVSYELSEMIYSSWHIVSAPWMLTIVIKESDCQFEEGTGLCLGG